MMVDVEFIAPHRGILGESENLINETITRFFYVHQLFIDAVGNQHLFTGEQFIYHLESVDFRKGGQHVSI